jgi:hypothetical protein
VNHHAQLLSSLFPFLPSLLLSFLPHFFFFLLFFFFFEAGSPYVAQADLELTSSCLPLQCWNSRHMPQGPNPSGFILYPLILD